MSDTVAIAFHYIEILRRIVATARALRMVPCHVCEFFPFGDACPHCLGTRRLTLRQSIPFWPFPADEPRRPSRVFLSFRARPPVGLDLAAQQETAATIAWMMVREPDGLTLAAQLLESHERANPDGFIYQRVAEAFAVLQEKDRMPPGE